MPVAAAALCEYYGYLPRLVRRTARLPPTRISAASPIAPTPLHSSLYDANPPPTMQSGEVEHPSTYSLRNALVYNIAELPPKPVSSLRLVIISDTHERHREMNVPNGDVLVHCGDIQEGLNFVRDVKAMLADFAAWFTDSTLHPHPVKLIIAGNHDKAIAAMSTEEVRRLFAPAVYLCDDSVVVEPSGVRFYGSPRSISNSCWSPNTAYQDKKAWKPFMFASVRENDDPPGLSTAPRCSSEQHLCARLEGATPGGSVDVLIVHQSPDIPRGCHSVEEQPICTYAQQVAPRRVVLCGHLHGAHGMHWLPVPEVVRELFCVETQDGGSQPEGVARSEEIPFLPCINAAMMMGRFGQNVLLPSSVVDLEV
ncbi:metallo-dependent phosphatase-like protein [Leishmania panamensis]|uniref:Metallo-dependent phosphatase-like protein, putative n=2 Tax=Leishmania guyanensis species complex TaxID=38579 RepID=A0A088S468_LEIPA|nr:metallo-dependent phosphatase-like protein [Leishmania panamensis]AIO02410.1 metallo-dependent phosphatase-like protein [Leishmania panamensis]